SLSDIADAIVWASGAAVPGVPANANPAKVINLSLGGGGACDAVYQNAINTAVSRGTVLAIAAGNSNSDVSGFRPANCA
ncbi:S8 family serine peptidase, partial [Lysobacter sp. 2RAB21]